MTFARTTQALRAFGASGPWRSRAFRWFFTGQTISVFGSALSPVALAFAVLNASGKVRDLSIVLAANSVPMLIFLLIGGAVADRFSRSTVLIFSNLCAGLTQAIVAVVLITGNYHLVVIAILECFNGTFAAFTLPALRGIVPQVVDKEFQQQANASQATAKNLAKVIGPTVGALLVVSIGGGWAIGVDGASYLIAAACMTRLSLAGPLLIRKTSIRQDIHEGWKTTKSLPWVLVIISCFSVTNLILGGVWLVLGPSIARTTYGESAWGLALSARAIGLLIMGVVLYRVTTKHFLALGQACAVLFAIPFIFLGLHIGIVWLVAATFLAGMGSAVTNISWETSLQEHVAPDVLSRVTSYDNLGSFIAVPIGELIVIPIAEGMGKFHVALYGGILYAVVMLTPLLSPSVRHLKHSGPTAHEESTTL